MWWEFFRLMELTPEALVDENEPVGLLEPIGPVDDVNRNGRQTWRYTFPPQDLDLGRIGGRLFDPARQQADPDASPFDWGIGDLVAVDLANATVDIKRVVERSASARRRAPPLDPDAGPSGAAVRAWQLGRGERHRRTRPGARGPRHAAGARPTRRTGGRGTDRRARRNRPRGGTPVGARSSTRRSWRSRVRPAPARPTPVPG